MCFLGQVYVLNRDTASRLAISSPLEAHKSNAIIFHTCGVDVGFDNPIFAVSYSVGFPFHPCFASGSSGHQCMSQRSLDGSLLRLTSGLYGSLWSSRPGLPRSRPRRISGEQVIELDYSEADQDSTGEEAANTEKQLVYYQLDLGLNHVTRLWSDPISR